MDLGTLGHEQLGNNDQQPQQPPQQQYPQQQSSAAATPLSPFQPAPLGVAPMLQAASAYYSTPPLMHPHHHDLASATKMSKLTTSHSPSGNGLGSAPAMKSGNDHKTNDQVVTEQAREIVRQAVVTAVTESNKAAAVANNNNNSNNNNIVVVKPSKPGAVRYRECQKNHAASIGGHAIDGCGEFMPGGDDGDVDEHRCAACDCHRNFHRREVEGECDCRRKPSKTVGIAKPAASQQQQQQQVATLPTPPVTTLALIGGGGQMTPLTMAAAMSAGGPTDSDDQDDGPGHIVTSSGMMMSMRSPSAIKKRFRTKFSTEQKDKMLAFAEEVGWRIQKHDEAAVHEFCSTVGVKRHVLKVWMHNNKHTMGKKP